MQIRTVLLSIQALLSAPNPVRQLCRTCLLPAHVSVTAQDDPLANDVAQHYKTDEAGAIRVSKEWTQKYAKP